MHDNVTSIAKRVSPFPQDSTLYFPVITRPDGWQDKHGKWHIDDGVKKLVRVSDKQAHVLATVGKGYRVVLNRELFSYVEERMQITFEPQLLRDAQVEDHMAYNGRDCFRHYTFPSLRCDVHGGGDVSFKIIVGNGYGSKAVQLITGAIDGFCTNGMIIGVHEKVVRKHTSGLTLTGIDTWLTGSIETFVGHATRMNAWSTTEVSEYNYAGPLFKHLISKNLMSSRHAVQISEGMARERVARGGGSTTLWHLYSALTRWASHDNVRETGNDHGAVTRIERGRHVERVIAAASAFVQKRAA